MLAPRGEKAKAGAAFIIWVIYSLSAYCRSRDGESVEAESEHSGSKYSVSAQVESGILRDPSTEEVVAHGGLPSGRLRRSERSQGMPTRR